MEFEEEGEEPINYPKCFGTKEVNPKQPICRFCEHVEDCMKLWRKILATHILGK